MKAVPAGLAFLSAAAIAAPAQAELLTYTITGDYEAMFQLDTEVPPDFVSPGSSFAYFNESGMFGPDVTVANIQFFSQSLLGGMQIFAGGVGTLFNASGTQLYSGPESDPTLLTGVFNLQQQGGPGLYTITVTPSVAAIPEPASWAMMIAGFGLVGSAMRRGNPVRRCNATV